MRYAKLINGVIKFAKNPIVYQGFRIANPPAEIYLALGYKPVRYTDPPETEPGYIAVPGWLEDQDEIVQTWTVEPEPEKV